MGARYFWVAPCFALLSLCLGDLLRPSLCYPDLMHLMKQIAQDYCGGGAISDMPQVWDIELKEEQIALICREVLRGLKYLHDNCIIHRDIKGANILLTEAGDVKLIDFGVSAVLAGRDEKRNTLIGTVRSSMLDVLNSF